MDMHIARNHGGGDSGHHPRRLGLKSRVMVLLAFVIAMSLSATMVLVSPGETYADNGGSFTLAVIADGNSSYVVEPCTVTYSTGATLREALEASGYGFVFGGNYITSVNGKDASMASTYYTGGWNSTKGYGIAASSIDSFVIRMGAGSDLSENHCSLLKQMGLYMSRTDGVKNYTDAVTAYNNAYSGLLTADETTAGTLYTTLKNSMDTYDSIMSGVKHTVNFTVTRGGSAYAGASITVTDAYGNVTDASSGTANLVAGDYTYEVDTADKLYATQSSFTVSSTGGAVSVSCNLPNSDWFSTIQLTDSKNLSSTLPMTGTVAGRNPVFSVPDYSQLIGSVYVQIGCSSEILAKLEAGDKTYVPYAVYTRADTGSTYNNQLAFNSTSHMLNFLFKQGMTGANVSFEIRHTIAASGTAAASTQIERCPATMQRTPTLSGLSVKAGTTELLGNFAAYTDTYELNTTANKVTITPAMFGTAANGYTTTVAGVAVAEGASTDVTLSGTTTSIPVVVSYSGGSSKTYTVKVTKKTACNVTLTHATGVDVSVSNSAGGTVAATSSTSTSSTYALVPGDKYSYIGTTGTWYHVTNTFTASASASVSVPTPENTDWLSSLALRRNNLSVATGSTDTGALTFDSGSISSHVLTWISNDTDTSSWLRITPSSDYASNLSYSIAWTSQIDGSKQSNTTWSTSDAATSTVAGSLPYFQRVGGYANSATLTVTNKTTGSAGETYYQDYTVNVHRMLTLKSLSASTSGADLVLTQTDNPTTAKFSPTVTGYTVTVPESATSLDLGFAFNATTATDIVAGGYTATIGDSTFAYSTDSLSKNVTLSGTSAAQDVTISLNHPDSTSVKTVYTIHVVKAPTVKVGFDVTPTNANATVVVTDKSTGSRVWPGTDGKYDLTQGSTYAWSAAASGYVAQSGTITPTGAQTQSITLAKAQDNTSIDTTITGVWPSFRLGQDNTSVTTAATPTTADTSVLYWAKQLGAGYSSSAAGCPVLVDGYLYSYGSSGGLGKIYKIDTVSGETVAEATMVGTSSFSITPMTYGDGMLFVALSGGRVEAFNAKTLESLWVYTDPLGGQPNCPIVYSDGCIYTGFWNSYSGQKANFVCLTTTDEDPTKPGHTVTSSGGVQMTTVTDAKTALWTYNQKDVGYYWAGAYVCDGYVLMGGDDGVNETTDGFGSGHLFSFDPKTGKLLDEFTGFTGDVRTTITYDETTQYFYFMTRDGYLRRFKMNTDGTFNTGSFQSLSLGTDTEGGVNCTTTPAIENGRAYVGVMGSSFGAYSGHHIAVIDLKTWSIAYTVATQGYPQATGLISSAYENESTDGYTYVYFIENTTPGKIRVIRDKDGMTAPDDWSLGNDQYVDSNDQVQTVSSQTARILFCPTGSQAQYSICSPIADEYGTIYFKNDSAYMMAVGSTITRIDVTTQPTKTDYTEGDTFDATGMKVTATYSNGKTRDITNYVAYSTDPLTANDSEITITFPHTMYQNAIEGADVNSITYNCPTTSVDIHVAGNAKPVVKSETLTDASASTAWSHTVSASAAPAPSSWALASGSLPQGLTLDTDTGTISGTPATGSGGSYTFSLTATNSEGTSAAQTFTLNVLEAPKVTTSPLTFTAKVGQSFQTTIKASGYPSATWSLAASSGALPDGLTLDASTGTISGTPTTEGTYSLLITASNGITPANTVRATITVSKNRTPATWTREAGGSRYETMSKIVEAGQFSTGGVVVLTTGENFPDALCASTLAGCYDAPIVLTGKGDTLTDYAEAEIRTLSPKTVYIAGGTSAVSAGVEQQVSDMGITAIRRSGGSRVATALELYKEASKTGTLSNTAIIATGGNFADALSVASYAYANKCPVFLASSIDGENKLDSETLSTIQSGNFDKILIVGGTGAVSDTVKAQLGSGYSYTRLGGSSRYATGVLITKWACGLLQVGGDVTFVPSQSETLSLNGLAVATGGNFPDALSVAALCGKTKSAILLMNDSEAGMEALDLVKANSDTITQGYIVGGTGAVSQNIENALKAATS